MKWPLFTSLLTIGVVVNMSVVNGVLPCSNVKFAYTAKGFDDGDVPAAAIPGKK